ncbi:MAG: hypothetical protein NXH89_02160 [Cyclobacteriaceae bacterium]|nr:hypothetical protein [Cyclobacteriaceae bacterium]
MKKMFNHIWLFIKTVFGTIFRGIFGIPKFLYKEHPKELDRIESIEDYLNHFVKGLKGEVKQKKLNGAYKIAWESKSFEIELYWNRATYFWTLVVPTFAGYFAIQGSKALTSKPELEYYVVCIGFIISLAWVLVNLGSKTWQRHWEAHVDILEDQIAGPIYKIVSTDTTFSVSKINEIVSRFFVLIWFLLGWKYWNTYELTIDFKGELKMDIALATGGVAYFVFIIFFGYGRGYFKERDYKFFYRRVKNR